MSRATEKENILLLSLIDLNNAVTIARRFSIWGITFIILSCILCLACSFRRELQVYCGIALFIAGCAFILTAPFIRQALTNAIVIRNKHAWKIQSKLDKLQPLIEEEKLAEQIQYEALKQSQMQAQIREQVQAFTTSQKQAKAQEEQKSQTKEPNTTLNTQSSNRPQPQISEGKTRDSTLTFLGIGSRVLLLMGIILVFILIGRV